MLTLATLHPVNSCEFNILAALLRSGKLALPEADAATAQQIAAGQSGPGLGMVLHSQLTLETLSFAYAQETVLRLSWLDASALAQVHQNLVNMLTRALGAHQLFAPMYPDFPAQVLAATDQELLINAWLHYLGDWLGVRILPLYTTGTRTPLKTLGALKPTLLSPASPDAIPAQLTRLLNANASLSPANKVLTLDLLEHCKASQPDNLLVLLTAARMPQKEIRALVGGWLLRTTPATFDAADIARLFQTPTDVLRLSTAVCAPKLAEADLTLTTPARFGKLSRTLRRRLLGLLDAQTASSVRAEMFQRREQWVRLGEVLHPGEYQARFARAYEHFSSLRNKNAPENWTGCVETHLHSHALDAAIALLTQRPGMFARKLHAVLRKLPDAGQEQTLQAFAHVADKASTPVLLQLRQRVQNELAQRHVQAFSPKAGAGRMWVPEGAAPSLAPAVAQRIVQTVSAALHQRFAKLPPLGKVYIDPALQGCSIPFAQRTAQKALRTLGRGSRVALGEADILRAFLWWNESGVDKNGQPYSIGRTDLDLSCIALDESFQYLTHCSFTQLRTPGLTHSGDITSAPQGACEFIDIDFPKLHPRTRYIALLAYAYTQQKFGDMPEAYIGWMNRTDGQSGEIYDARTVQQKVDLAAAGQRILTGYADVMRREFVWADLVLSGRCGGFNAVESSTIMTSLLARGIVTPIRPTLGDLLTDHAQARGSLVTSPDEADILYLSSPSALNITARTDQTIVTAYDAEILVADYLQ